jgi:transketolase N-terminal domain/subunit
MDNAHAHLAHLVVTQKYFEDATGLVRFDPEEKIKKYGIHCDKRAGCDAYGGSLGHALGIAIGWALVNSKRKVYCIVSDGSMMEGSNWEALRIMDALKLDNIHIYCNFNGYSAVAEIDFKTLVQRMTAFRKGIEYRKTDNTKQFDGIKGHYIKI